MTKAHSRHSGAATPAHASSATPAAKPYRVRRSPIHGTGVFATRAIPKGARVVEYVGERVSHAEADRRYEDKDVNDNHTFLFTVDDRIVIDAGVRGNEARWINHSCDPNCETVIENKRVYIEAARDIAPGEELAYDYMIGREPGDPPDIEEIFACRCGAAKCRGTMLLPPKKTPRKKPKPKTKTARKGGAGRTSGAAERATRRGTSGGRSARKPTRASSPAARKPGRRSKPARKSKSTGRAAAKRAKQR